MCISKYLYDINDIIKKGKIYNFNIFRKPLKLNICCLENINNEAKLRWNLVDSLIIHRYGKLYPGDQIVLVATFSEHRADALESCEFLIDWLKTKAPFWKLEESNKGKIWVEEKMSDVEAANKW